MEPPFYEALNKACRELDESKLETLGPFAVAIGGVLGGGYLSDIKRDDALEQGIQFHNPYGELDLPVCIESDLGFFCRSFLLFRGALMEKGWMTGWREDAGKSGEDSFIHLPGCTSTSKNLDVALGFSGCHKNYSADHQPVLFVFSIRNWFGFNGFRLNDYKFSVYPQEQEYLLMEGF